MVQHVEKDYPGYYVMSKQQRRTYQRFKKRLEKQLPFYSDTTCIMLMNTYTAYFNDSHFGIYRNGTKEYRSIIYGAQSRLPEPLYQQLTGHWYDMNNQQVISFQTAGNKITGNTQRYNNSTQRYEPDTFFAVYHHRFPGTQFLFVHRSDEYQYARAVKLTADEIVLDDA